MNRDPKNLECTRDPIFILLVGTRQWTAIPDGCEFDGESMWIEEKDDVPDWILPFVDAHDCIDQTDGFWKAAESELNDHNCAFVYIEWRPESVFLTRKEAEAFGKAREYRWDKWKVYCIPCDGELAKVLNEHQPETLSV